MKNEKSNFKNISIIKNPFCRPDQLRDDQIVSGREYLAYKRIIYFDNVIDYPPSDILQRLLMYDSLSNEPIKLLIYSPGGNIEAGFVLTDIISRLRSKVITVALSAQSMAVLLFMAGTHRYLLPHTRIMLYLPYASMAGDAKEMEIANKQLQSFKEKIAKYLISRGVKRNMKKLIAEMDRDKWMEAEEAISCGIGDKIITKKEFQELL